MSERPLRPCWRAAYVGLGSNLDDPAAQVRGAFAELAALEGSRLMHRSSLYRTPPMGPAGQPDYINAVAALLTQCDADTLLAQLQGIEQAHARDRTGERWGPRTLDLDLLVFAREQRDSPTLTLPHAGIAERAFVLAPLYEVAPYLDVPKRGSVRRLLAGVSCAGVERLDPS